MPRSLSVLVVDDDSDTVQTFRMLLSLWGHKVRTATDGPAALAAAAASRPDVVLLDLKMPNMTGFEVAERLRQAGRPPLLVALTGLGTPAEMDRVRQAGFDDYFLKPVNLYALADLLRGYADGLAGAPAASAPHGPDPGTAVAPEGSARGRQRQPPR